MDYEKIYEQFDSKYEKLIPSKHHALLLLKLFEETEIDKDRVFTLSEIKYSLKEISGRDSQYNMSIDSLLDYLIENPQRNGSYKLTRFAEKFLKLLISEVEPYKDFPLVETIKNTYTPDKETIKKIENLEAWFEKIFQPSTKEILLDSLEALKRKLNEKIKFMGIVLRDETILFPQRVEQFSTIIQEVSFDAKQITEAIDLGNKLSDVLLENVTYYQEKVNVFDNIKAMKEPEEYYKYSKELKIAENIKNEVEHYWKSADKELKIIWDKIRYAMTKVDDLRKSIDGSNYYTNRYEKLLSIMIKNSQYNDDEIKLSNAFLPKTIYGKPNRFSVLERYNFLPSQGNEPLIIENEQDTREEILKEDKLNNAIEERIQEIFIRYKEILNRDKYIDFSRIFYQLYQEEKNIVIPIEVGDRLFSFASQDNNYEIIINEKQYPNNFNVDVAIWTMIIKKKQEKESTTF
jgi:hypothetical protein